MANRQFQPFELHPKTGEPFLRLPSPHEHIILTPPHMEDVDAIRAITNDPLVYLWMGPAAPFSQEHAERWVGRMKSESDRVIEELERAKADDELRVVDGCPTRCIREQKPDGTEVFLGHMSFNRCKWVDLSEDQRNLLVAENEARKTGDPEIVWQVASESTLSRHGIEVDMGGQTFWHPAIIAKE